MMKSHAPRMLAAVLATLPAAALAEDWKPAKGPLTTRWAKDVRPDNALPEYPRPQLVRGDWANLNGLWQMAFGTEGDAPPFGKELADQILVPYPVESALSGVMKPVPDGRVWYRRTFGLPESWRAGKRILLHFGAVDWESTVWVNGKELGTHKGGYDGFSYDVTDALKASGEQEVVVRVLDRTDATDQPRGKQTRKPGGIFYTPTTGIWQTVWIEPVGRPHITGLKVVPDVAAGKVSVEVGTTSLPMLMDPSGWDVRVTASRNGAVVASATRKLVGPVELAIPDAALWTPETPNLYDLAVELSDAGKKLDSVGSYFGMRTIAVGKDDKGVNRLMLNGKPVFQVGPLDQGFWPDGLYTAPTDEALRSDIEVTKKLGFNMTRKHVKVEPDRWYYWCDRLGLLVWQDMPSGGPFIGPNDPDGTRSPESARQYDAELKAMIDGLQAHPSIVIWVVFNEGWGQFDTRRVAEWTKVYDPTRLVDAASGWTDRAGVGDLHDLHVYPHPAAPALEPKRAGVLGEFGGLGLGVDDHTWQKEFWGYQGTASAAELTGKYERLLREGWELKDSRGLNALVYTQITDVETECNGLLTYDRAVMKLDPDRAAAANRGDFSRVPEYREVVPTSLRAGQPWRYTTEKPSAGWETARFDASAWKEGPGVLGTKSTPGAEVRTTWNTPDIWARRDFDLPEVDPSRLLLSLIHDEGAEVYLNGVLAAKVTGYTAGYEELAIAAEALATLKAGKNILAVHCHQTAGGQAIDAGLIEVREPKKR